MANSGFVLERPSVRRLTSQTKPGPNMAFAVAIMVARRFSREPSLPNDLDSSAVRWVEGGVGSGERVEKNWWLFQAMDAWLKRDAAAGSRA